MNSIYSRSIYPHLMDFTLKGHARLRSEALNKAYGNVLEVGFGTGLNLPYYPLAVRSLCALDVATLLPHRVEKRIGQVNFSVEQVTVIPDRGFPLEDNQFDCVVTTWTLCSVSNTSQLLYEIRRVLRPNGIYIFLEHGRVQSPRLACWQSKLSNVSKILANGCRLDMPIDRIIQLACYQIVELKRFDNVRIFKLATHMYQEIAVPNL